MAIGKRTRFEIFKRDGFRCTYCGVTATQALMHVDHVVPVAEGGADDPENLVTACADCNLGKSDVPLEKLKFQKGGLSPDEALEHAEQIRQYLDAQKELLRARDEVLDEIELHWCNVFKSGDEIPRGFRSIAKGALADLPFEEICESIEITNRYVGHKSLMTQVKYFCGILRKKRRRAKYGADAFSLLEKAERMGFRDLRLEDKEDGRMVLHWRGTETKLPDDLAKALFDRADDLRRGQA